MLVKNFCAVALGALAVLPCALGLQAVTSDISALKPTLQSATKTIVNYDGSVLGAGPSLLAIRKLQLAVQACKSSAEASDVLSGEDSEEVVNEVLDLYPQIASTLHELGPKISSLKNPAIKFVALALAHVFQSEETALIDIAMEKLDQEHTSQLDGPVSQVRDAFKEVIRLAS